MLRVEGVDPGVEVWTVERPQAANALDAATVGALEAAVARVAATPARVVIFTGAPRPTGRPVFVAGADLRELAAVPNAEAARAFSERMVTLLSTLERLPTVFVAAVDGDALGGGCELLTAFDLVVAAEHARFSFRQARMGVGTGWGGATRLVHRVGLGAAKRLLFTAEHLDAREALRVGLIDEIAPAALPRALALATLVREGSFAAIGALKANVGDAVALSREASYRREIERFVETWAGPDHRAALRALAKG